MSRVEYAAACILYMLADISYGCIIKLAFYVVHGA
jgi:hypothetical protein